MNAFPQVLKMILQAINRFSSSPTSYAQEYCATSLMCDSRSCLLSFMYQRRSSPNQKIADSSILLYVAI